MPDPSPDPAVLDPAIPDLAAPRALLQHPCRRRPTTSRFIDPAALGESIELARSMVAVLERDCVARSLAPMAEPQRGRRGLCGPVGGATGRAPDQLSLLWLLNQADGRRSLLDIAERIGLPFAGVADAADALEAAGLVSG